VSALTNSSSNNYTFINEVDEELDSIFLMGNRDKKYQPWKLNFQGRNMNIIPHNNNNDNSTKNQQVDNFLSK